MKKKIFTALGLMSGTSMDGVDLSIIKSDGYDYFITVLDDYTKYDGQLYKDLTLIRDKIHNQKDLIKSGANIIIYANHLMRSVYPNMVKTAKSILKNKRSLEAEKKLLSIKDILELIPGTK